MANELAVREHPVVVRERSEDNHEDKKPDRIIDAKYKVIRESRFNKDKAKRIPGHVGRLAKEVGKTVWGYTIGHESNEKGPMASGSASPRRESERVFHPDDVVARRSTQVTDTTGPFWSSNSLGGGRSPLNQTVGQSFSWGLQSLRRNQTSPRYNKKHRRSKTWKKRR